ncbi:MAG: quercetin dioxygenase-like cupin family protein [Saprospiraceae bacterium]|jgi:quercetin dioxygenase-like cupin family protein
MIEVSSILKDAEFNDQKPVFKVLLNTSSTKELRIMMRKAHVMKEHPAPHPIVVEVFSGSIDFRVEGEVYLLEKGDLITLSSRISHDLLAHEDSVIRLSLSKNDNVDRLKEVIG